MASLQRFAAKLHFAGEAEHWELAACYLHEIEKTAEEILEHNPIEDGIELAPLIRATLQPAVAQLEQAVKAEDPAVFAVRFEQLLGACNTCHQSAKHGFVRIVVPRAAMFPDQDFARPPAP